MKQWTKALLTAGLVVVGTVAGTTIASADAPKDANAAPYADAMWYFLPQLGRYADELDMVLEAVQVKPEAADQLKALAHRGEYMVYDLEGTPVPAEMADENERLLAALRQLNEAAQIGVEDAAGARYLYETYVPMLEQARHDIRGWMMGRIDIGSASETPALVVGQ